MPNALTSLLSSIPKSRTAADYECMCDDYVRSAGGARLGDRFAIPQGVKNADYHFDFGEVELLLELKQLTAYRNGASIDEYFSRRLAEGRLRSFKRISPTQIHITPESMSTSDWNHFYKRFRRRVVDDLVDGARQLKRTEGFLPAIPLRRIKGVLFLNSGDYHLPTDLLMRIVEWKLRREWDAGHFTSIDFALGVTVDMWREGQHPLYGNAFIRTKEDTQLVAVARHLHDQWVHYGAAAIGADVEYREGDPGPPAGRDFTPHSGKLQWVPTAHTE